MDIITLTAENLKTEHICCSLNNKSTERGVNAKKEWIGHRIEDGLRFKKIDVRGKAFIEYLPAENAWVPIEANSYMYINCFWVSGSLKGKGYGKKLLSECERDAIKNGFKGIALIVGKKKKPYLSDKEFMLKNGYEICDSCPPYFELLAKRFDQNHTLPQFKDCVHTELEKDTQGIDIYYTAQCPFTTVYIQLIEPIIQENAYPVRTHLIETKETARQHPAPVTTYSVFVNGKFYTNEILTIEKLKKMIEAVGL